MNIPLPMLLIYSALGFYTGIKCYWMLETRSGTGVRMSLLPLASAGITLVMVIVSFYFLEVGKITPLDMAYGSWNILLLITIASLIRRPIRCTPRHR